MSEIELKVFLESKIEAVEKVLSTRMDANALALSIQTREFERRLDDLNGEQDRIAKDRERSVPREIFEQFVRELTIWRTVVETFMATARGQSKGVNLSWSIFTSLVAAIVSALLVWATLIRH